MKRTLPDGRSVENIPNSSRLTPATMSDDEIRECLMAVGDADLIQMTFKVRSHHLTTSLNSYSSYPMVPTDVLPLGERLIQATRLLDHPEVLKTIDEAVAYLARVACEEDYAEAHLIGFGSPRKFAVEVTMQGRKDSRAVMPM